MPAAVAVALVPPSAAAAPGELNQLAGPAGCIIDAPTADCTTGRGLNGAFSVATSPDGANVYVPGINSGAVAVFRRDQDTGELTQLPGADGCLSSRASVSRRERAGAARARGGRCG